MPESAVKHEVPAALSDGRSKMKNTLKMKKTAQWKEGVNVLATSDEVLLLDKVHKHNIVLKEWRQEARAECFDLKFLHYV